MADPQPAVKPPCQSTWRMSLSIGLNWCVGEICSSVVGDQPATWSKYRLGNRHVYAWTTIGGRTEDVAFLAETEPPGVIVGGTQELQCFDANRVAVEIARLLAGYLPVVADGVCRSGLIRSAEMNLESPEALAKTHLRLAVDDRLRVVVALHGPDPVVGAILEVANSAVGIAHRPTCDERLAKVGFIVAVDVFHVDRRLAVLDDDTSAIADKCGRDAEILSKDRELVRMTVVVRVLADLYSVTPLRLSGLKLVGIVDGFANPETTVFVPVHCYWLTLQPRVLGRLLRTVRPVLVGFLGPDRKLENPLGSRRRGLMFQQERILHLRERCVLSSPARSWRVVGNLRADVGGGEAASSTDGGVISGTSNRRFAAKTA